MTVSAHANHSRARHQTRRHSRRQATANGQGQRLTDHDRAVLRAEVKALVMALSPFRVLRRDALARAAGATRWHEEAFDQALAAAVDAGAIKELPLGFYGIGANDGSESPRRDT